LESAMMETPRSKTGLLGRNAKDMRLRAWGELRAVRQLHGGWWSFQCEAGHVSRLNGVDVRREDKLGRPAKCKECGR
jgi:NAD-dependent SIR2 family protein deacetylase